MTKSRSDISVKIVDGRVFICDDYGNVCAAPVEDVLIVLHRYQQSKHGERVVERTNT